MSRRQQLLSKMKLLVLSLLVVLSGCSSPLMEVIEKEVDVVTTPPTISTLYPESGASGIAVNIDNIVITFNKSIDASSVSSSTIVVKNENDALISGSLDVSGDTVSFNPSNSLAYDMLYSVTIKSGLFDIDGNDIGSEFSWSFRTADAPSSIKPLIKYIRIDDGKSATNSTTVNMTVSSTDYNGDIQNLESHYRISGTEEWSDWLPHTDGILNINDITLGSIQNGEIVSFEVETKDGSDIISNIGNAEIIYDLTAPFDVIRSWEDPDFDLTMGKIQITFGDEMDLSSLSDSNFYIELEASPGHLQGQIDLTESNGIPNSAIVLQGISLNPYTDYKVTLGSDATDIAGNPTGEEKTWHFRTGQANDIKAPNGPVSLIDRGVGAYVTTLPSGTLATNDYRIRIDLTEITDDYHSVAGMKFWGDFDQDGSTPTYIFEPTSWELFPSSNIYKDWEVSNTAGTKSVLYRFMDTYNRSSEEALQIEVFLDNERPTDPVLTINEGDYTNNSERIINLSISSSDVHTGLKGMKLWDTGVNDTGWIDWSTEYNEWVLPDNDGEYTITVTVKDYVNLQSQNIDTASIILDRVPPEITYTSETIMTGTALTLNGSYYSVTDPDPGALTYQIPSGIDTYHWEQLSGPGTLIFSDSEIWNPQVSTTNEGSYYMALTVTDNAGNSITDDVLFIWDSTPPADISSIDVEESAPGYSTTDQPEWTWSASSGVDFYEISFDNFAAPANTVNIGNATTYTPQPGQLAEGSRTLYVRASDFAGNHSATISKEIIIDTVAPVIDVRNSEFIANISTPDPELNFSNATTFDGLISGADSILWEQTDGPSGGLITFGSPAANTTTVEADLDGNYTIRITASDNAGNVTTADLALLNDLNAPPAPDVTGSTVTPNLKPTWYWSGSGGGNGNYEYRLWNADDNRYYYGGSPTSTDSSWTSTTDLTFKPANSLTDQVNWQMQVREVDSAGNWSSYGYVTTEVNTTQTTPAEILIGDGYPLLRTVDSIQWKVLSGSGGIATNYRYYYDNSGTWIYGGTGLPTGTPQTFSRSGLSEGDHSLTIQEYFNDLWQTTKTAAHTVTVDTIAPNTPVLSGEGLNTSDAYRTATNDNYPTWSWTSGGGGNGQYKYSYDTVTWYSTTGTSFTPYKAEGTYTLYVKERDDAGNWSSYNTHSITVDTTPPVLTSVTLRDPTPYNGSTTHTNSTTVYVDLVGDISAEDKDVTLRYLDYNPASAYETYGSPFAIDGTMTISTVLPSTNGTRSVYAQLVDEAGNGSAYRNDSIILDTVAPTGTFKINNGASYTPSLSFIMNLNITDNLTQVSNLKVQTYDYYGTDGDGSGWENARNYAAVMTSDCQFSKTAGSKAARALIYDEAGNSINIYDSIYMQVPVPQYAYKGFFYTGYSNVYYTPVTEDGGANTTRYYTYSTSDPAADPNNGDPVTYEGYTTSTVYDQVYIPKGEILYFFTRAYNADTGGFGPYSASNVMGFSSNVTVVYDASDSTDAAKAQYIKELLEDTYFSGSILDETNMAGTMPTYTVTLLDEDLINNTSYSTNNTIYGDPIIVTPGTAFTRLSSDYDIRARHIANGGRGLIGMASNGLSLLDRIEDNWTNWGLSGTAPTQIGSGESAGISSNRSSKTRPASSSENIWISPMKNSYFASNFSESNITLNIFSYDVYRYGVYLTNTSITDGYVYAADPNYSTYYPVVRQGRFLQFGYTDIPGRDYTGAMTYQYGQVFFINLIARMDNY